MNSHYELDVEIAGDGSPMLLIHGFASSRFTWRHLVDAYRDKFKVIAVDLLGHGRSPKPAGADYSINHQAALVQQVINKYDLRDITLVGHSFGGGVALKIALEQQQSGVSRLKRLVLIGSAAYPQVFPPFIRILRRPILGRLLPPLVPPRISGQRALQLGFHDHSRITKDQIDGWAAPMREKGINRSLRQTALQILPDDLDDLIALYPTIDIPTLLIWGQRDRIVPLSVGERLNHALPNVELKVVPDCGHIPHEELPEPTIGLIDAFLSQPG